MSTPYAVSDNDNSCRDTISTLEEWYQIWLDAFGGARAGIWQEPAGSARIPYITCTEKVGGFSIETAAGAANDHTPRYDILGVLHDNDAAFRTMLADLGVSVLVFPYVSQNSRLLARFPASDTRLLHHIEFCEASPRVNCEIPWDDYWKSRGKSRQTWSRRERQLIEKRNARFHVLRAWEEVDGVLGTVLDIEASGWKGRSGTAIKQEASTLRFYTRLIEWCARMDLLRLFVLELDERIIAFQITTQLNGAIFMLKIGYLEEYGSHSPGQVLQTQILRWAFSQPDVKIFDMLGGGGEAFKTKMRWATEVENLYTLRIFRNNLPGAWAWLRYAIAPRVKRFLVNGDRRK